MTQKKQQSKNQPSKQTKTNDLSWADMTVLLEEPKNEQEKKTQKMIRFISESFGLPPQGINILGGKPYINKDGLSFKLSEYYQVRSVKQKLLTKSEKPEDQALAKTTIVVKDKDGSDVLYEGLGTASAKNIQMSTIRGFANEMALTRSFNRCVRPMVIMPMYRDFLDRVNKQKQDKEKMLMLGIESVSAEEAGGDNKESEQPKDLPDLTNQEYEQVSEALNMIAKVDQLPQNKRKQELNRIQTQLSKMKKDWNDNQVAYVAAKFNKQLQKYGTI